VTSIWSQGWYLAKDLGLDVIQNQSWSFYTSDLQREHIHLIDNDDELAWYTQLLGGQYSTKLGYRAMVDLGKGNILWWFKKLWKIRGPPKGLTLFWLVLKGKFLT
jgi:hypothetical protein